jgi:hypothetical protein
MDAAAYNPMNPHPTRSSGREPGSLETEGALLSRTEPSGMACSSRATASSGTPSAPV